MFLCSTLLLLPWILSSMPWPAATIIGDLLLSVHCSTLIIISNRNNTILVNELAAPSRLTLEVVSYLFLAPLGGGPSLSLHTRLFQEGVNALRPCHINRLFFWGSSYPASCLIKILASLYSFLIRHCS